MTGSRPGPGRWRQLDLWRYVFRVVALTPLLMGLVVGLLTAVGGFRTGAEQTIASLAVAACVSFLLDDAAAPTLAYSPTPLWFRRSCRLAFGLPVTAVTWAVVVRVADALGNVSSPESVEVGTMTLVALAAAAVAIHRSPGGVGGAAGPPAVLVLAIAGWALSGDWALQPVASHEARWLFISAAAVAVIVATSRDPAARSLMVTRRLNAGRPG